MSNQKRRNRSQLTLGRQKLFRIAKTAWTALIISEDRFRKVINVVLQMSVEKIELVVRKKLGLMMFSFLTFGTATTIQILYIRETNEFRAASIYY